MQSSIIEKIAIDCDKLVRDAWKYTPDGKIDKWIDYSDFFTLNFDDAMSRNPWASKTVSLTSVMTVRGDCDDQTMTTLCIMNKRGVPLDRLHVGAVYADEIQSGRPPVTEKIVNHAVGMVEFAPGEWRIVGDTFEKSYRIGKQEFKFPHKFVMYGSFLKPTQLFDWIDK